MADARRRLAKALSGPPAGSNPQAWFEPAEVTVVIAGAASDGNALVTVARRDGTDQVPYLASYTPTVGHTVLLLVQSPQAVIVGRVLGTP